ncbi:hypothetical protein [Micromonospora sp. NBC_01412]|uniref:hypothetical protein n=1 Tax=Micromonospora sp. NBC_01412 TaxID=2903590 RepID=UPI0032468156
MVVVGPEAPPAVEAEHVITAVLADLAANGGWRKRAGSGTSSGAGSATGRERDTTDCWVIPDKGAGHLPPDR